MLTITNRAEFMVEYLRGRLASLVLSEDLDGERRVRLMFTPRRVEELITLLEEMIDA